MIEVDTDLPVIISPGIQVHLKRILIHSCFGALAYLAFWLIQSGHFPQNKAIILTTLSCVIVAISGAVAVSGIPDIILNGPKIALDWTGIKISGAIARRHVAWQDIEKIIVTGTHQSNFACLVTKNGVTKSKIILNLEEAIGISTQKSKILLPAVSIKPKELVPILESMRQAHAAMQAAPSQ